MFPLHKNLMGLEWLFPGKQNHCLCKKYILITKPTKTYVMVEMFSSLSSDCVINRTMTDEVSIIRT